MAERASGRSLAEWRAVPEEERPDHINARIRDRDEQRRRNRELHDRRYSDEWSRIKAKGDAFFREIGALDEDGNFVLTADVPKAYLQKALYVLNDKLEEGSLEAVKIVIPLVQVEAPAAPGALGQDEARDRLAELEEQFTPELREALKRERERRALRRKALVETN